LDGFKLLAQEVLALVLLDLLVHPCLDFCLHLGDVLLVLDEYKHFLDAPAHHQRFQNVLLLFAFDIQDACDEIGKLARMIDVDHVQPHLFTEDLVVFGEHFHFGKQKPGPCPQLLRLILDVLEVLHLGHKVRPAGIVLLGLKALQRRDEYADAPVGELDFLDNLGNGSHSIQILMGVFFTLILLLDEEQAQKTTMLDGLVDDFHILVIGDHQRGKQSGKHRVSGYWENK